tara:strand:- start:1981 stop:2928 length:948 start_codon:yes stop_codon:yes gene_type:complete
MDFSEYTLVSFGDSFTFGQDTVPPPSKDNSKNDLDINKLWKLECNKHSYTQSIADSMGFKDSLNFGVMGGSNDRSISLLESFLRSNPKKKIFVLFNFTSSARFMLFPRLDENFVVRIQNGCEDELFKSKDRFYDCIDILPHHNDWMYDGRYTGINTKSVNQQYTYWRNSVQEAYNHVKDRRMLYYMLSSYNVPYVTFDGINDMDYRILRDNPTQYINIDLFCDGIYNENEDQYILRHLDFLQSYHKELEDKYSLLAHISIDKLNGSKHVSSWLRNKCQTETYADYFVQTGPSHWNTNGHIEVANLIQEFINERYN